MTQDILSSMDSDEVNSIDDTVESMQVAQVIKTTFFEIINSRDWPHLRKLLTLNAVGATRPTHFYLPPLTQKIYMLMYNKATADDTRIRTQEVKWLENEDFLRMLSLRDSSSDTVETIFDIDTSRKLLILNDHAPTYWTSFNDSYVVMDSYDSEVDSTLQESKLMCLGYVEPSWEHIDSFIPDLPSKSFPYFLSEAKSTCFYSIKQMPNEKEELKSRSQRARLSVDAWRQNGEMKYASYGRKK